jgi:hypothetical protein
VRRRRSAVADIDARSAAFTLSVLAAFASWPVVTDSSGALVRPDVEDMPVQRALRAMIDRHRSDLLPAVEAYVAAVAVLHEHDAEAVFEQFRLARQGGAGHWPTLEGVLLRRRLRPVLGPW